MNKDIIDIGIIGGGPAGATCAFYLAQKGFKVTIFDKKKFPRRKICGDAITLRAQEHLEKMGVLQEILDEKKGNWAALGGIVSPSGIEYYGDSSQQVNGHLVIAIKREIMDEKVVKAAVNAGAKFVENFNVETISYDQQEQTWSLKTDKNKEVKVKFLVIADGAPSRLARTLGLVTEPPQATCSSVYIKAGTHKYEYDGVCYYPRELVPGYCALFKEANGDLVYCCYIIPGGKATTGDLTRLHHKFITNYPPMSEAIGKNAEVEKMKAAPIRFGGIKKSYAKQLLIVGDAAGQIDPLTGEGIQYAMDAAEIAAETIIEAFMKQKMDEKFLKRYHNRWMKSFGKDFKWSARMTKFMVKHPIFLDAFASLSKRKGDAFMVEWGKIMTGSKPKAKFFQPKLALPLFLEVLRLKFKKKEKQ